MLDSHLIAKTCPIADNDNIILYRDMRVTVLTDRLFRVEQNPSHEFCDSATQAVWFRNTDKVRYSIKKDKNRLTIETDSVKLIIEDSTENIKVRFNSGKTVIASNKDNLMGTYRTLDCCEGNMHFDDDDMKNKTPISLGTGVVSKTGVAVYDDSNSLLLGTDGKLMPRPEEKDIYIFAYGTDYRKAVDALYTICGKTPIIPKFALGNWWSRYHAYTSAEYLLVMDRLKKRNIPLTVATVDMDWHWSTTLDEKKGITASGKNDEYHGYPARGWTGYSWNTDLFPDYKAFLNELKKRNLHITLNLHPARGVRYFEDMYREMAQEMGMDADLEQVIPFDFTSDKFINAYFKVLHKPYEHDGVDFWWIDWQQGTQSKMAGLDPLWALNHYHTLDNGKEHAPLILSRYCGIGANRYPLGFSGDTTVSWETLDYLPYFTATAANAGYTWWSHDIGGHMIGIKDDELYARFVQFGVFSPINRLHCTDSRLSTKEPAYYMNGMGLIAEEYLRLRHKMIPYLYSVAYDTHTESRALIEPMYYEYPNEKQAYAVKNQYMFGKSLMVLPMTHKGDKNGMCREKMWIPEGHFTDIFTGDEYDGNSTVDVVRWTDTLPVLAKEGAVFPLDARENTNSLENTDMLDILVFCGNGSYCLHEETQSGFCHTEFENKSLGNKQILVIKSSGSGLPCRKMNLQFRNIKNGKVNVWADKKQFAYKAEADAYLTVQIENVMQNVEYVIEVEYEKQSPKDRINERLHYSMLRINGDHIKRANMLKTMFESDIDTCKRLISETKWLTKNEKVRLYEAFYIR